MGTDRRGLRDIAQDLAADPRWGGWPVPQVLDTTESTMVDVERAAADGAPEGFVVIAEEQTAGRGRRGRTWESAKHAGLWFSMLLMPREVATGAVGWLPLVVGLGVAEGLAEVSSLPVLLKWPNDVVIRDGDSLLKLGGILAERLADGTVVVGVGLNVDHELAELPPGGASLRTRGAAQAREDVLVAVLANCAARYRAWRSSQVAPIAAYCGRCVTLGSRVRMDRADGELRGTAIRLDESGRLVVVDDAGVETVVTAGDVSLVRPLG